MAEVSVTINGRSYDIACDDGQEQRLIDLAHYVDSRVKEITKSGAAGNEMHSLVLSSLVMADEIFDLRDNISVLSSDVSPEVLQQADEMVVAQSIESLASRIDHIAERIQKA